MAAGSVTLWPQAHLSKPRIDIPGKCQSAISPLVEFLFFHKAIRAELSRLHQDALAVEQGSEAEITALLNRYHFLRAIYKHHSRAEDEDFSVNFSNKLTLARFHAIVNLVSQILLHKFLDFNLELENVVVIFPALDLRVKNVAHAYSLEHKVESDLFDQMFLLLSAALEEKGSAPMELRRELICCTEAIQTTLCQHFSKEEEQVFPLLMRHFSFEEQADLVWQFLCSIPVNLMEKFLPWLATSLTHEERQQMTACLEEIVPEEQLLQQVVFAWLEGGGTGDQSIGGEIASLPPIGDLVQCGQLSKTIIIEDCPPRVTTGMLEDYRDKESEGKKLCEPDIGQDLTAKGLQGRCSPSRFPINELLYWHNAIRKELRDLVEETRLIKLSEILPPENLSSFVERLQFLAEVCIFHSTAEDKVLFPAVNRKVQRALSCAPDHAREEQQIDDVRRLVEGLQSVGSGSPISSQLYGTLCAQAEMMVKSIRKHLHDEEIEVLPLARKHFSVEEQRSLLYQSLRVMPLKLLERVLPWLVSVLSEEEAKDMFRNMRLAAPVADKALVTLFTGWACKGNPRKLGSPGTFRCISPKECPARKMKSTKGDTDMSVDSNQIQELSFDSCCERPLKRLRGGTGKDEAVAGRSGIDIAETSQDLTGGSACCVPGLGCNKMRAKSSASSLRSVSMGSSNPLMSGSLGSGLFGWGNTVGGSGNGPAKPIDHIFQFHKAIRKDLEYLDTESAHLANCTEEFLRQFSGRFQFLWGLYRAHSNAEDDIVFPALEAKEALHNVSHSYTIDHKQEERLLKEISDVLQELSQLHSPVHAHVSSSSLVQSDNGDVLREGDNARRQQDLAGKLQRMCKSVRISLDHHVSREEVELWPLFDVHFTIEEQDKLVGQIIGTTGAEVLQAMLPWVTTALTEQEQNTMMDTWRQATRNTMFDKWLSAWWKDTSSVTTQLTQCAGDITPPSGSDESLQLVADYLGNGSSSDEVSTGKASLLESSGPETQESNCNSDNGVDDLADKGEGEEHVGLVPNLAGSRAGMVGGDKEEDRRLLVGDGSETFKPGWRDIFRMNQKELEAAIRKVSRDSSLDPRRKAYLIQNLMTSRWIVAQQQLPNNKDDIGGCGLKDPELCVSFNDESRGVYGCEHYQRNCKIKAACCGLITTCRFCHDKVSDHTMDRHATKEMMCMKCLQVQPVAQFCATPACNGYSMAKYYCVICKFFNNDDREIYHCPFCNLCRVGKGLGQDCFHCMTCNACMSMQLTVHKCLEKGLESDCPICHDFLFTSNTPVKALPCGHFMHSTCFKAYTFSNYTCPICSKSVGDMAVYFGMLDTLLAAEQLPVEYHNRRQEILCNDCGSKGTAPFHWLYHKCSSTSCRSYNTRTI